MNITQNYVKMFWVFAAASAIVSWNGSSASTIDLNSDRELLRGKHFVIGTIKLPPYIFYTNVSMDGRVNDASGFIYEILLYIATKYQFTFEYVESCDGAYGAFVNGSWNGLVGMLIRNELDFATSMMITYPRSNVIDYSVPYDYDPICLLIPHPTLDSTINGIARPFQFQVWLFIGISLITLSIVLWVILSFEFRRIEQNARRNDSLAKIMRSLLCFRNTVISRNVISRASKISIYFLLVTCCLAVIVLINSYSSTLTSCLITPRYRPMIESVEDIANDSRPIFMALQFSSFEANVLDAEKNSSLTLSKIGDSLRKHPELRLSPEDVDHVADLIVDNKRSYTFEKSVLLSIMEEDLKKTGQCRLYIAKHPWDRAREALALPKSSSQTQIVSTEIHRLREAGLLDYWQRRSWPRPNRCSEPLNTKIKSNTKLTLNYVSSVFLLLGCGLAASFLVFLIEIIIGKARCLNQRINSIS